MNKSLVTLRATEKQDHPFIYNSMLLSYLQGSQRVRFIPKDLYFHHEQKLIESLLNGSYSFVLASTDEPDVIYGYILFSVVGGSIIFHYTYVKPSYRNMGFATYMIDEALRLYNPKGEATNYMTHLTTKAKNYLRKYKFIYNPYLLGGLG